MMSQYVKCDIEDIERLMRRCPQLVKSKNMNERISTAMQKEHCVNYNALKEKEEEPSEKAKAYIKRRVI